MGQDDVVEEDVAIETITVTVQAKKRTTFARSEECVHQPTNFRLVEQCWRCHDPKHT